MGARLLRRVGMLVGRGGGWRVLLYSKMCVRTHVSAFTSSFFYVKEHL